MTKFQFSLKTNIKTERPEHWQPPTVLHPILIFASLFPTRLKVDVMCVSPLINNNNNNNSNNNNNNKNNIINNNDNNKNKK